MAEPEGPLGTADLDEMKVQLVALDRADKVIDQAIRGGLDMSTQKAKAHELRAQLTKLRQSFFPGR